MVNGKPAKRETLKFRLLGSQEDVGSWGHEYVRFVSKQALRIVPLADDGRAIALTCVDMLPLSWLGSLNHACKQMRTLITKTCTW